MDTYTPGQSDRHRTTHRQINLYKPTNKQTQTYTLTNTDTDTQQIKGQIHIEFNMKRDNRKTCKETHPSGIPSQLCFQFCLIRRWWTKL